MKSYNFTAWQLKSAFIKPVCMPSRHRNADETLKRKIIPIGNVIKLELITRSHVFIIDGKFSYTGYYLGWAYYFYVLYMLRFKSNNPLNYRDIKV